MTNGFYLALDQNQGIGSAISNATNGDTDQSGAHGSWLFLM